MVQLHVTNEIMTQIKKIAETIEIPVTGLNNRLVTRQEIFSW
jgi:hypothetical protein